MFDGIIPDNNVTVYTLIDAIIDKCNNERHIPEIWPKLDPWDFSSYGLREKFIKESGFILVSYNWVRKLNDLVIKNKPCLEVMAGTGMLSKALKDIGVPVITTDNNSWRNNRNSMIAWKDKQNYTDIEEIDALEAVHKYGNDVDFVIMSWPYMDDTAYKVLIEYKKIKPSGHVIYIGEEYDGCTANDDFFDEMYKTLEYDGHRYADTEEVNEIMAEINKLYISWPAIHDEIFVI